MIQKAVESLNTGKAADEHGLKAEHFKNSPHSVYIFLEMCFKRILDDKITPYIFKTGILTPVSLCMDFMRILRSHVNICILIGF